MGTAASKEEAPPVVAKGNKICVNCNKASQVDHPDQDRLLLSEEGCGALYAAVDQCMQAHAGRITACVDEWQVFRLCHDAQPPKSISALQP